ncbi:hypothetical protein GJ496_011687 [Pomphorhynchus laevis]|nr:hypothetical protein GJ496_011687 [Pomphorhynchus laevis]
MIGDAINAAKQYSFFTKSKEVISIQIDWSFDGLFVVCQHTCFGHVIRVFKLNVLYRPRIIQIKSRNSHDEKFVFRIYTMGNPKPTLSCKASSEQNKSQVSTSSPLKIIKTVRKLYVSKVSMNMVRILQ